MTNIITCIAMLFTPGVVLLSIGGVLIFLSNFLDFGSMSGEDDEIITYTTSILLGLSPVIFITAIFGYSLYIVSQFLIKRALFADELRQYRKTREIEGRFQKLEEKVLISQENKEDEEKNKVL